MVREAFSGAAKVVAAVIAEATLKGSPYMWLKRVALHVAKKVALHVAKRVAYMWLKESPYMWLKGSPYARG